MEITEVKQDLFTVPKDYILCHCVSADFKMGAGIAKEFADRGVKDILISTCNSEINDYDRVGKAILTFVTEWAGEINLITKDRYWHKPSYEDILDALVSARDLLHSNLWYIKDKMIEKGVEFNHPKIAMPRIASGLDKKDWNKVRTIIENVFDNTAVEILVCVKE